MQGNRCPNPNCQNDLNEAVTAVLIAKLQTGESGPMSLACPHCGEELTVTAAVKTTVELAMASAR